MLKNSFKLVPILKSGVFVLLVWLLLTPLAQAQVPEVIDGLTCDLAHNHQTVQDGIRNYVDDAGVAQSCPTRATCVCVQNRRDPQNPDAVLCAFELQPNVCDQDDRVSQCFGQQLRAGFGINGQLAANLSICFDQLDTDNDNRWRCGTADDCPTPPDAIIRMVGNMTIPVSTLYDAACDGEVALDDKPPLERVCEFHLKPNVCVTNGHCDDGNACTTDSCDPQTYTCSHVLDLVEDDHNACTRDICDKSGPVHTPIAVNDGDACTVDRCDPKRGITHTPIAMNDGNVCTVDRCDPARGITHTLIAGINDNNACTTDTCDQARGQLNTPIPMDDHNACTVDSCDPATGVRHRPVPINDNDACTRDACDPATGRVAHNRVAPVACYFGPVGTANVGICHGGQNDCGGDACVGQVLPGVEVCDGLDNDCDGQIDEGVAPQDGNRCDRESCVNGVIVHTVAGIDDRDACTRDSCDPVRGVIHTPILGCRSKK